MNDDELRREYQRSVSTASLGAHPDPERLSALVSGDMPEAERYTLLEHVLRCRTCKAELDLLRAANEGVRAHRRWLRARGRYYFTLKCTSGELTSVRSLSIARTHIS